jgi:hypothetical protein
MAPISDISFFSFFNHPLTSQPLLALFIRKSNYTKIWEIRNQNSLKINQTIQNCTAETIKLNWQTNILKVNQFSQITVLRKYQSNQ